MAKQDVVMALSRVLSNLGIDNLDSGVEAGGCEEREFGAVN